MSKMIKIISFTVSIYSFVIIIQQKFFRFTTIFQSNYKTKIQIKAQTTKIQTNYIYFISKASTANLLPQLYKLPYHYTQIISLLTFQQMQTSQIVRKRLLDLKKLSQNLKQSTQTNNSNTQIDTNLIKAILSITKIMPSSSPSQQKQQNNRLNQSATNIVNRQQQSFQGNKKFSMSTIMNKHRMNSSNDINTNDILLNQQTGQPLFPQNSPTFIKQSSISKFKPPKQNIDQNMHQQQLIHLRQLNISLQKQLKQVKQKLALVKQQEQEQRQKIVQNQRDKEQNQDINQQNQDWTNNNTPYFRLNQHIDAFVTRLTINSDDYQKIEYAELPVKLTLDKFIIQKKYRKNSNKSFKVNSSSLGISQNFGDTIKQNLQISNLIQVQYLQDNKMLLIFAEADKDSKIRLFLHFDDEQTIHRWDLAIYINYTIIQNLNSQNLFLKNKKQEIPTSEAAESRRSSFLVSDSMPNTPSEEKLALKKYFQDKKKFIQSHKHLKQIMLHKITSLKQSNLQASFKKLQDSHVQNTQSNRKISSQQSPVKKDSIDIQTSINLGSPVKTTNTQNQLNSQNLIRNKQITLNEQKINNLNQSLSNLSGSQQIQKALTKSKQQEQQQRRQLHKTKVVQAIKLLKAGMFMTKYAKSAFNPHQKRVFISNNLKSLCWQDKDSPNSLKSVLISQIESLNRGQIGPGVEKHIGINKIKNVDCFLLINTTSKDRKTIQLGVRSLKIMTQFYQSFLLLLQQSKKDNLFAYQE